MDKKQTALLIREYETGRVGYRTLSKKYGVSLGFISKMIRLEKEKLKPIVVVAKEDDLPDDVKILKEEIRKLRLQVELQDIMIEIAGKELGVDLRKKRGARQL
jgi:hypothetical protein